MTGIIEMFAELDGYTNGCYEAACERYYAWTLAQQRDSWQYTRTPEKRRLAVERTRAWRIANPEKRRELGRAQGKRDRARGACWDQRYPDKARMSKARYIAANRERQRETWRRNSRAARARKAQMVSA